MQGATRQPTARGISGSSTAAYSRWDYLALSLLPLIAFSVFLPVLENGFVNFDDDKFLLERDSYRGLGASQLKWIFTESLATGSYQPLTWLTWAIDYTLWGLNPFGFHLSGVLFHAVAAALVFVVARRLLFAAMGPDRRGVTVGALAAGVVFAVHPLRVEPVAWVAARGHVMLAMFFLASLLCYLRAHDSSISAAAKLRRFVASIVLYACSLLCIPAAVAGPIVLLVIDVYPLRRLRQSGSGLKRIVVEKIPYAVLSVGAIALAPLAKTEAGAFATFDTYGIAERVAQASYGLWFYVIKTVAPQSLIALYEVPRHLDPYGATYLLAAVGCVAMTALVLVWRKRAPALAASWLVYALVVGPMLGVLQSGPQFVACRYSYLSCVPWALLIGGVVIRMVRAPGALSRMVLVILLGFATVCATTTWRLAGTWRNAQTLWRHTLSVDPDCAFAHYNLAHAYEDAGDHARAIEHYRRAIRLRPGDHRAWYNLGKALLAEGDDAAAMEQFVVALKIKPDYVVAHVMIGNMLGRQGDAEGAVPHYRRALEREPNNAEALYNLGYASATVGREAEAVGAWRDLLKHHPDHRAGIRSLAYMLSHAADPKLVDTGEAIELAERLCRLSGSGAAADLDVLAAAYFGGARLDEAVRTAELAVEVRRAAGDDVTRSAVALERYRAAGRVGDRRGN